MKDFIARILHDFEPLIHTYSSFNENIILLELQGNEKLKDIKELPENTPVRMELISFMIIGEGFIDVTLNYRKYHLENNMLLHVESHQIVQDMYISPNMKAWLLLIKKEFLPEVMGSEKPFPLEYILSTRHTPHVKLDPEKVALLIGILKRLQTNIGRTEHLFRKTLVINDFTSFSMELGDMIHKMLQREKISVELIRKEKVMTDFVMLLNEHSKNEHAVSFYAGKLCMSSQNLTRILKEISGETVNKWIARAIVTEARILLKNKELSIQEIAAELNFADQASFSKFFKKHHGISPQLYRQRKK